MMSGSLWVSKASNNSWLGIYCLFESGYIHTDSISYLTLGLSSGISCGENVSAAPILSAPCDIWTSNRFACWWVWQLWSTLLHRDLGPFLLSASFFAIAPEAPSDDSHQRWTGLNCQKRDQPQKSYTNHHSKDFKICLFHNWCPGVGLWREGLGRAVFHLLFDPQSSGWGALSTFHLLFLLDHFSASRILTRAGSLTQTC